MLQRHLLAPEQLIRILAKFLPRSRQCDPLAISLKQCHRKFLDVYKRQAQDRRNIQHLIGTPCIAHFPKNGHAKKSSGRDQQHPPKPVSYTHLDVYKRQVLGCGVIAREMAEAMNKLGRSFSAVGNRTYEKAVTFANTYHIPKVYPDLHQMFTDPEIDIIYVATPHNLHFPYVMEALKAGKHVLCEKAIMLNSRQLKEADALAKEQQVILAEAMRCV